MDVGQRGETPFFIGVARRVSAIPHLKLKVHAHYPNAQKVAQAAICL